MEVLVEMRFGSHLYGTQTPSSDLDFKAVHIPAPADILLQRAKGTISEKTKADGAAKNTAEDIDRESYSLQKYLHLASEGQTVALDMLFAPEWSFTRPASALWLEIQTNRHRLLTRRYASFMGYCRDQANKYGIKGSRVAASRLAMDTLAEAMGRLGTTARLREIAETAEALSEGAEHMDVNDQPLQSGMSVRHWRVCGRSMPYTATIKSAHEIMARLVDEYGRRALQAEQNEGVDWKALSHAVRIGRQAIEVLETANVVFPRPDAAELLSIKLGERPYREVADEIERLLAGMEDASARSTLPERPDAEWIERFVTDAYRQAVLDEYTQVRLVN